MNTLIVGAKEFKGNFSKYEKLVNKGVSLTIVKRSKPIFKIEPIDTVFDEDITKALLDYEDNKSKNFVSYDDVF